MDAESVYQELLSRFFSVDNSAFFQYRRDLEPLRFRALKNIDKIKDVLTLYDDPTLTVNDVEKIIKKHARRGLRVAYIDYLQRMSFIREKNISMNWATVISNQMVRLAEIAKRYNVSIIVLSQLRNDAEGERATIEHLKDSGGIGEAVDCALILNNLDRIAKRKDVDTIKQNIIEIDITQRRGSGGTIKCNVDLSRALYYDEHTKPEFWIEDDAETPF